MNIEFVEPGRPSRKVWIIAGIPWILVLILGALFVYLQARVAHEREAQLAAEAMAKTPAVASAPRVVPPYQEEAMAALKRAALPEADALAELEHVAVMGIQLRSIDVNPAASVVVVELEATSDEVLGDYLDQLNAGMPTPRWHIRRVAALGDTPSSTPGAGPGEKATAATRSATIARDI
jgi:hypothetical protein